jgi:hypothetical protein
VRADEQKSHSRLSLRASQHKMTKPNGTSGQGKCDGCAPKAHVLIRGDLSAVAVRDRVVGNQPGHWLIKVQAHGVLPPRVSEAGSAHAVKHSAPLSNRRRERIEVSRGRISCVCGNAEAVKG